MTEEEGRGGKTVERMPPPAMDDPARSHVAAVAQPQSRQTRLFAGDVRAHFALGRTIGKGSFGKVKAAVARMPLELERGRGIGVGAHVAVKLVEATGWTATQYDEFYRECFLLAQVEHANVVRLIAVYKNARKSGRVEFAMVTELATGGELFDRIQRVGRFSERAASRVVRKLLGALSYLHARGIAHRDIKVVASLQSVREEHAIALAGAHGARDGTVRSHRLPARLDLLSVRSANERMRGLRALESSTTLSGALTSPRTSYSPPAPRMPKLSSSTLALRKSETCRTGWMRASQRALARPTMSRLRFCSGSRTMSGATSGASG